MSGIKRYDESGGGGGYIRQSPVESVARVPGGSLFRLQGNSSLPNLPARPYPETAWAPEARALVVLTDFLTNVGLKSLNAPLPDPDVTDTEITDLITKAAIRDSIMPEILAQHSDPLSYWADLLSVTAALPRTWDVIVCAETIGRVIATHFKALNNRPRPAQIAPALMPPLQSPLTPSHPGCHATEAYLIAECLNLVSPALYPASLALANRIADNRETAGLNYNSDTTAAASLAKATAPLLATPSTLFAGLLKAARGEWGIKRFDESGGGGGQISDPSGAT